MSERKWGIRTYPRYEPSRYIPISTGYDIREWKGTNENEIAGEPLTYEEATVFIKLLTKRSANDDSE